MAQRELEALRRIVAGTGALGAPARRPRSARTPRRRAHGRLRQGDRGAHVLQRGPDEGLPRSADYSAWCGSGSPTTKVRVRVRPAAGLLVRGHRSTWIGRPAGSGPARSPFVPGPVPHRRDESRRAGTGTSCAAHADRRQRGRARRAARRRRRAAAARPGSARASSATAADIPASAARCAARRRRGSARPWAGSARRRAVVDGQRDAVGPQPVGDGEREVTGHDRIAQADPVDRERDDLPQRLVARTALLDQSLEAQREDVEQLGLGQRGGDALRSRSVVRTTGRLSTSANRNGSMIAIGTSWRSAAERSLSPKSSRLAMRAAHASADER